MLGEGSKDAQEDVCRARQQLDQPELVDPERTDRHVHKLQQPESGIDGSRQEYPPVPRPGLDRVREQRHGVESDHDRDEQARDAHRRLLVIDQSEDGDGDDGQEHRGKAEADDQPQTPEFCGRPFLSPAPKGGNEAGKTRKAGRHPGYREEIRLVDHSGAERIVAEEYIECACLLSVAMIRFDGQVTLVTGSGRGRAYGRLLASRGAQVIVHDAGVSMDGSESDPAAAAEVVDELTSSRGRAVACIEDPGTPENRTAMVAFVQQKFARLDVLIHNAGLVAYQGIEATERAQPSIGS